MKFKNILKSGLKIIDGDNYTEQFLSFLENGFYIEVSKGTSRSEEQTS
jgi:hypothetical protein